MRRCGLECTAIYSRPTRPADCNIGIEATYTSPVHNDDKDKDKDVKVTFTKHGQQQRDTEQDVQAAGWRVL